MNNDLYILTVSSNFDRRQLLNITGSRHTIIDAALRVILDCAPAWDDRAVIPAFNIDVRKISK